MLIEIGAFRHGRLRAAACSIQAGIHLGEVDTCAAFLGTGHGGQLVHEDRQWHVQDGGHVGLVGGISGDSTCAVSDRTLPNLLQDSACCHLLVNCCLTSVWHVHGTSADAQLSGSAGKLALRHRALLHIPT
jgi:hypothetical protein